MLSRFLNLRRRLVSKLILTVGLTLLLAIATWAYFNIRYQKDRFMEDIIEGTDRLSTTIRLGTHYAMMLNSRDDINQIIQNISRQKEIENIRIYNKEGQIKFSNRSSEVDLTTNIKDEACYICHRTEPPLSELALSDRTRIFQSASGYRLLGIISPIRNDPGCSADACHIHPHDKQILGALDVVVSLKELDRDVLQAEKGIIGLAAFVFLLTATFIFLFVLRFVNRPIRKLIQGTQKISKGTYSSQVQIDQEDEMGQLAAAINQMGEEIGKSQAELNKQRDEYQTLFEQAPCLISVQDRNYKLINYNRDFEKMFAPQAGDYCYQAYKGLAQKCDNCPVEKTFLDGHTHYSEETGLNKDGSTTHWFVRTAPIKNTNGDIVAAMEMSLDITQRKQLEEELGKSEKKYHEIFNNIPNPVFVLDITSLEIIDCNDMVKTVYGYNKQDTLGHSFLEFFQSEDRERAAKELLTSAFINQIKHLNQKGEILFVNIRVSPSDYPGRKVLLVTTSDITKRLEAEQQLIQASKMATLGEMATGVAHELNPPLSVIKTASSFCLRKFNRQEPIKGAIFSNMLSKIDGNVDRATKIINHMRQFARKSEMNLIRLKLNEVMQGSFDIFSQQLKVRGIEVVWNLDPKLPPILGDPDRLEQVFINLLLNARDAIEDRWTRKDALSADKVITLKTWADNAQVWAEVCDTGHGIPPGIAQKIFEPFFTTKEVGKGTGLGLSISYGIVKDCGGSIQARNNPGGGACFQVNFPTTGQGQ